MLKNTALKSNVLPAGLLGIVIAVALAGCNNRSASEAQTTPAADTPPVVDTRAEELNTREQELAQREAAMAAKEHEEEARLQAEEAARLEQEAAAAKATAAKKASQARAAAARRSSSETAAASTPAKAAPAPVKPAPIDVPAGTQLTVALSSDLSSKTAKAGDAFEARLVSDLMINERRAVPAGARVTGTITDVISGSKAIGSIPTLGLKFDQLELPSGQLIPITGELKEQGKSEKVRDTAKILGGAAAGAVLGHQVKKGDSGKVIGGILGGAVGAVAAKKTGTEVQLPAGATLTIALGEGFRVASP